MSKMTWYLSPRPWPMSAMTCIKLPSYCILLISWGCFSFCQREKSNCLRGGKIKKIRDACVLSHFSCIQLCATTWTVALQAPLSMEFSMQEYWHGLQGIFHPRVQTCVNPALADGFFTIWEAQIRDASGPCKESDAAEWLTHTHNGPMYC